MAATLEFVSSVIDGLALIAMAASVGGLAYIAWIWRPLAPQEAAARAATGVALATAFHAALAFAGLLSLQIVLKAWATADGGDAATLAAFAGTGVFKIGFAGIVLALLFAGAGRLMQRRPQSPCHWSLGAVAAAAVMVQQGMSSHAASRLEHGAELMLITGVHQLGAMVWVGGVIHLLLFWRRSRANAAAKALWPGVLARFSPLGVVSMALILGPGLYLALSYVGTWDGLLGTGHGNAVVAKIGLLAFALVLAGSNFSAGLRWRRSGNDAAAFGRTPAVIEVESGVAVALLFVAAALAALPPAIDVGAERASLAEVWQMFSPKIPHLQGPKIELIKAPELNDTVTGALGMKEDLRWSHFNHNLSGVIVLAIALAAFLDRTGRVGWARHWPLLFTAFSILILLFANNEYWPIGWLNPLSGFSDPEVVQHWLAAVLVFFLGLVEWRARAGGLAGTRYAYVFPVLCGVGGLLLVTHAHAVDELKTEFLIQSTHLSMGVLGILVGCGRWLELRMAGPYGRAGGNLSVAAIGLVGLILLFYVEP